MSQSGASRGSLSGVFPPGREVLFRTLSCLTIFLGLSITSFCFAHRLVNLRLFSHVGYRSLSALKILMVLLLVDSWIFLMIAGTLINGLGTSLNAQVCHSVMRICVVFYFLAKGIIYFILVERLYVVWPNRGTRLSSTVWRICMLIVPGYIALVFCFIFWQFSTIREDMQCVVGNSPYVIIMLLSYDGIVTFLLTGLFLLPLWRGVGLSPELRKVATRTIIATIISLVMTISNLLVLIATKGQEIAWICLTACSLDICGNSLVMFWLTLPRFRRTTEYTTSASISTGIRARSTTKTYELDTLFGLSASSSLPTGAASIGVQIDTSSSDSAARGSRKQEKPNPSRGIIGRLGRAEMNPRLDERVASRTQDPEIELGYLDDKQLACQDDIDIALSKHSLADVEMTCHQAGRSRV